MIEGTRLHANRGTTQNRTFLLLSGVSLYRYSSVSVKRIPGDKALNTTKDKNDRRASDRFPMEREVRYRILNRKGDDEVAARKTVDMSSNGAPSRSQRFQIPTAR